MIYITIIMNKLIKLIKNNYEFKKKYFKNQIIFNEGDLCTHVALLISGSIIINSYTFSGKEIIFNKINKNEIFGQTLIFSQSPYYKGKVTCQEDVQILFISKDKLLNLLINKNILNEFLKIICDEVLNAKQLSRLLAFDKVSDRLLYLLYLNKEIKIKSISQLAKEINVSRENLSKTIKKLTIEKKIIYTNNTLSLY